MHASKRAASTDRETQKPPTTHVPKLRERSCAEHLCAPLGRGILWTCLPPKVLQNQDPNSVVPALACTKVVAHHGFDFFELDARCTSSDTVLVFLDSCAGWSAQRYSCQSPVGIGAISGHRSTKPLIAPEGEPGPLLQIAARVAFGSANLAFMKKLAQEEGLAVPNGVKLYGILRLLVTHYLPDLSDNDVLDIMLLRIKEGDMFSDLLGGRVSELLEEDDSEMAVEAHRELSKLAKEAKEYQEAFATDRQECRQRAQPKAKGKAKAKAKANPAAGARQPRDLPDDFEEMDVQGYMPPGDRLYRDPYLAAWRWYWKGVLAGTRGWQRHGFKNSALILIRLAWDREKSLGGEDCPWQLS